jgi:Glycosyltransferase family 87
MTMTRPWRLSLRTFLHRAQCALFVVAAAAAYWVAASPAGTRGTRYIVLHLVLTLLMLGVWATTCPPASAEQRWTLVAGILARALLVAVPVFTSSDVVRYLWDGRVALAGLDPYRVTPSVAAKVIPAAWSRPPVHATLPTLYPPGAIALFALCASFGPVWSLWAWKAVVLCASILTLLLTATALRQAAAHRHLPLVALSPLLVLEGGVGVHVDMLAALSIAGAVVVAQRKRPALTGMVLAFGALIKLLPAVAVVPLAAAMGRRRAVRLVAGAAAVVALGYAGAFVLGLRPIGSVVVFFRDWQFASPMGAVQAASGGGGAIVWALSVAAAAVGLADIGLRCRDGRWGPRLPYALALPLLPSPVVFPWYLSSLVPALALAPSAFLVAWVSVLPLSYEVLNQVAVWEPAAWVPWAVAAAWGVGIVIDLRLKRGRRSSCSASPVKRISIARPARRTVGCNRSSSPASNSG